MRLKVLVYPFSLFSSEVAVRTPFENPQIQIPVFITAVASMMLVFTGCDTGFGSPSELPRSDVVSNACSATMNQSAESEGTAQEFKASCAIDDFPTCETQSCLVYRGSSPFCSNRCSSGSDCEGDSTCCPLFGECDSAASASVPVGGMSGSGGNDCSDPNALCYCVRAADLLR